MKWWLFGTSGLRFGDKWRLGSAAAGVIWDETMKEGLVGAGRLQDQVTLKKPGVCSCR